MIAIGFVLVVVFLLYTAALLVTKSDGTERWHTIFGIVLLIGIGLIVAGIAKFLWQHAP